MENENGEKKSRSLLSRIEDNGLKYIGYGNLWIASLKLGYIIKAGEVTQDSYESIGMNLIVGTVFLGAHYLFEKKRV